jgi:N6-L-threonylcarbamoyladenine synthase
MSGDGAVLSDVRHAYSPPPGMGIHPRDAAEHHSRYASEVIKASLMDAGIEPRQIDCVAVALGPGLGPALRVGATVARCLALSLKIPLVPVHHAIGHIEIGCLTSKAVDPLVVLVSGGHTAIVAYAGGRWRIFGETEDITLGNLLDMFARSAHLPFPGGVAVERLAAQGKSFINLPYTVKGNDVSYSGLLTSAERLIGAVRLEDLCFSLQEVSFSMLSEVVERSLAHTEKKELLLTGGVAVNKSLQEKLRCVAEEHSATFHVVDPKFSGDSGAQIAWAGLLGFKSGLSIEVRSSFVRPRWRLDQVDVRWRKKHAD